MMAALGLVGARAIDAPAFTWRAELGPASACAPATAESPDAVDVRCVDPADPTWRHDAPLEDAP